MFEVIRSQMGYAKLADGTMIYLRLVITAIKEEARLPVGFNLAMGNQVTILAESPPQLKSKIRDKPQPPKQGEHLKNFDIWDLIDIVETKPALEEVRYKGSDNLTYRAAFEIEPTIASRTLEYKDENDNPLYYIRWSEKISTRIEKT